MKNRYIQSVIFCIFLTLVFGCTHLSKDTTQSDFKVKVHDFYGAEGYGYDYYLDDDSIVIIGWDDFGNPQREVFRAELTPDNQREWHSFWMKFPLDKLKNEYINQYVSDGIQREFVFSRDSEQKTIILHNKSVRKLNDLCSRINKIVPDKYRMYVP